MVTGTIFAPFFLIASTLGFAHTFAGGSSPTVAVTAGKVFSDGEYSKLLFQQFTEQKNIRLRGRSFALKVESNVTGVQWRLGTPRVEIIEDGRR